MHCDPFHLPRCEHPGRVSPALMMEPVNEDWVKILQICDAVHYQVYGFAAVWRVHSSASAWLHPWQKTRRIRQRWSCFLVNSAELCVPELTVAAAVENGRIGASGTLFWSLCSFSMVSTDLWSDEEKSMDILCPQSCFMNAAAYNVCRAAPLHQLTS
jgi:hypothetical protein